MDYKVYNTWNAEEITVIEIDYDYDLHAFEVKADNKDLGTIYPNTVDEMEDIIAALNDGESPIGWETGTGATIGYAC